MNEILVLEDKITDLENDLHRMDVENTELLLELGNERKKIIELTDSIEDASNRNNELVKLTVSVASCLYKMARNIDDKVAIDISSSTLALMMTFYKDITLNTLQEVLPEDEFILVKSSVSGIGNDRDNR